MLVGLTMMAYEVLIGDGRLVMLTLAASMIGLPSFLELAGLGPDTTTTTTQELPLLTDEDRIWIERHNYLAGPDA